jgi:hypothetical protein
VVCSFKSGFVGVPVAGENGTGGGIRVTPLFKTGVGGLKPAVGEGAISTGKTVSLDGAASNEGVRASLEGGVIVIVVEPGVVVAVGDVSSPQAANPSNIRQIIKTFIRRFNKSDLSNINTTILTPLFPIFGCLIIPKPL